MNLPECLDLSGVPCPANAAQALLKLATCASGEQLAIILDAGEPMENVPAALTLEGHKILETERLGENSWRLLVEAL